MTKKGATFKPGSKTQAKEDYNASYWFMVGVPLALVFLPLILSGFARQQSELESQSDVEVSSTSATVATSSSAVAQDETEKCTQAGGQFKIEMVEDSNIAHNICVFEDNFACENEALERGDCPVGGLKITGFETRAQAFCAISGGQVDMDNGTCVINGQVCEVENFYRDQC